MKRKAFTLIELLVVIAIIALLLAILMPSLGKAKKIAQAIVCRSNLKQFAIAYSLYGNDNNNSYPQNVAGAGVNAENAWYLGAILPYYQNKDMRMCPSTKPQKSNISEVGSTFKNWGPLDKTSPGSTWFDSEATGSFGFNNWVANPPQSSGNYWGSLPVVNAIRRSTESMAYNIPFMADSAFVDTAPLASDSVQQEPDTFPESDWDTNSLRYYAIDRHSGGINAAFGDYSVRHVGIRELWRLKWHKNFNTTSTPPGGWPGWTDKYKKY